eukprot:g18298.t1
MAGPFQTHILFGSIEDVTVSKHPGTSKSLGQPGYAFVKFSSRHAVSQAVRELSQMPALNWRAFHGNPQGDWKTPLIHNELWSEHLAPDGTSYYYDCEHAESSWGLPAVLGMQSHQAQDVNHMERPGGVRKVTKKTHGLERLWRYFYSPASIRGDEQPERRKSEFVDEQVRLYRTRLSPQQFSAGEGARTVFVFGLPVSWSSNTLKQICQLKVSAPTVKVGAMAARV